MHHVLVCAENPLDARERPPRGALRRTERESTSNLPHLKTKAVSAHPVRLKGALLTKKLLYHATMCTVAAPRCARGRRLAHALRELALTIQLC